MTTTNKLLSIEDADDIAKIGFMAACMANVPTGGKLGFIGQQLSDTMRENERLRNCLTAFYFDTMYKDSPGLHDLACELLAPHNEEFAEVQRRKHSEEKNTEANDGL